VPVRRGQAGERIACPECGRDLDVPRLRDLARLEPIPGDTAAGPIWDTPRRWLLAGGIVAILAGLLAANVRLLGGPLPPRLDAATIRRGVAAADIRRVYEVWKGLEQADVERPLTPEERRQESFEQSTGGLVVGLWCLAGLGCATAAGAVLILLSRRAASTPGRGA